MWFMIFTARYERKPKVTVWNCSEKIMSVKINVLKKASFAKLYNGISWYFAKQREIGIFS